MCRFGVDFRSKPKSYLKNETRLQVEKNREDCESICNLFDLWKTAYFCLSDAYVNCNYVYSLFYYIILSFHQYQGFMSTFLTLV